LARQGTAAHEKALQEKISELKRAGYRVVALHGMTPDAIATKNGKLIAVDILGQAWTKRGLKNKFTYAEKERQYLKVLGFDELIIATFIYESSLQRRRKGSR